MTTNSYKKNHPQILTHKDTFKISEIFGSADFVVAEAHRLFVNKCPHRLMPIVQPGTVTNKIACGLHGWEWTKEGVPCNNHVPLRSLPNLMIGESGLLFVNWQEPREEQWVSDLRNDQFVYSHSLVKHGTGCMRWQMEMHVDLLHVPHIHRLLNRHVDVNKLRTSRGDDWIAQYHEHGWWLFVYPYTHIEYESGRLYISEMRPVKSGGYDVFIHYLFNPSISALERAQFTHLAETTMDEDIRAVNQLSASSQYTKPHTTQHPLEVDTTHFYQWLKANGEI